VTRNAIARAIRECRKHFRTRGDVYSELLMRGFDIEYVMEFSKTPMSRKWLEDWMTDYGCFYPGLEYEARELGYYEEYPPDDDEAERAMMRQVWKEQGR
jgi:hypothetical protein